MNPSREIPRKRRRQTFTTERLEDRQVLSAGMGSTFAIMPGTVEKAGQVASLQFKLDPSQFTAAKGGKILLGIDIAADPNSKLVPQIVSIKNSSGRIATRIEHSRYSPAIVKAKALGNPMSTAVLASIAVPKAGQAPGVYTVQVRGNGSTTGKFLVGFFLPGDTSGKGVVSQEEIKSIRSKLGVTPTSSSYSFDADVNRDGRINNADIVAAKQNLGAKTMVSPIIDVNLDPATDGPLRSRITNFRNVRFIGTATPNATITFAEVKQKSPGATSKVDSTGKYNITVPLGDGSNTFQVTTQDAFGQSIVGTIAPVTYTLNPPTVMNTPQGSTTNTGKSTS